jgi:predicted NBD/HSP70 family sugar kinase
MFDMRKAMSGGDALALTGNQSASNRTPRHINRNLIFSLIRRHQPISRADLARRSGLRRSTVSLIIEELLSEEWVLEGEVGQPARGRKPVLIHFNEQRGVIALDIHPSQTTIALADISGRTVHQEIIPLTLGSSESLGAILEGIRAMMAAHPDRSFVGIGVCLPGRVDPENPQLLFAPRLNWPSVDVRGRIAEATGIPVEVDNVANACAQAEVWFGDSNGAGGLVVVNVSEGIAVGMYLNGKIFRGHKGMAGEFGHVQMQAEGGVLCACGNHGCWETLASNTAALRFHRELTGEHAAPTFDLLLGLALGGQAAAVEALTHIAAELGRGIRVLLSGFAPTEIVIVGDIARAWPLVGPLIEAEVHRGSMTPPAVLRCIHGDDDARIRGAVALTLSQGSV